MRPIYLTIAGLVMMCSCEDNFNRDQMLGVTSASPKVLITPAILFPDAEVCDDMMNDSEER